MCLSECVFWRDSVCKKESEREKVRVSENLKERERERVGVRDRYMLRL